MLAAGLLVLAQGAAMAASSGAPIAITAPTNTSLIVSKSTDFGNSWNPVIARDNRGKQGQEAEYMRPVGSIAVDRKSAGNDIVYVGYATNRQGFSTPNAAPREPTMVVSTDGG